MRAWAAIPAILTAALLGCERPAFAQAPVPLASRLFVDGAVTAERDPTDYFYGTDRGSAARGAIGVFLSEHNSLRLEVDVPRWRVQDTSYSGPVWCAGPSCVNGDGVVPARTTFHTEVRSVSYSVLYARHLPAIGRLRLALVAGASTEERRYRSSGSFDQLAADGQVLAHDTSQSDSSKYWPAIVVGGDAEINITSHVIVVPQFRFHTFPYPSVSIVRTGIGLRYAF